MKIPVITLFLMLVHGVLAGEYLFKCEDGAGPCDRVYDKDGKVMRIKINYADPESAELFLALQKKRIYGTNGFEDHMGVKWKQEIRIIGEFTSEVKQTSPKSDGIYPYRDFRMTGIKLAFPVWRFQESLPNDPPNSAPFMETHFSFETLFPQGLRLNGKLINLKKHAIDQTR